MDRIDLRGVEKQTPDECLKEVEQDGFEPYVGYRPSLEEQEILGLITVIDVTIIGLVVTLAFVVVFCIYLGTTGFLTI